MLIHNLSDSHSARTQQRIKTAHLDIPKLIWVLVWSKLPTENIWQPEEFTDSVFNHTVGVVKPVWSYQTCLVFTAWHGIHPKGETFVPTYSVCRTRSLIFLQLLLKTVSWYDFTRILFSYVLFFFSLHSNRIHFCAYWYPGSSPVPHTQRLRLLPQPGVKFCPARHPPFLSPPSCLQETNVQNPP